MPSSPPSTPPKRCAVVGAGAAGLACARWALAYGFLPVVFERRADLGGLWRYTSKMLPNELATVMRCTVTNSSKELTAFSDFPPDPLLPNYMRHEKMLAYLEAYARHHNLEQYIQFDKKVIQICRSPDYAETGQWTVQWQNGDGQRIEETFHCILVAIGHHAKPNWPTWPGLEQFQGKVCTSGM
uniref:Flavin-containing monooxygenase n=1 Tax=Globodera pallida TaxID=36090 RepID=A0A183BJL6_GLOPA